MASGSEDGTISYSAVFDIEVSTSFWDGNVWTETISYTSTDGATTNVLHGHCQSSSSFCMSYVYQDHVGTNVYCYAPGSIIAKLRPTDDAELDLYCAHPHTAAGQTRDYVWVECNGNTIGELVDNGRFICKDGNGATAGGYEWFPAEICGAEGDEDGDGIENCADFDCYSASVCRGQPCASEKVVTWSYVLPSEDQALAEGSAPVRKGCCRNEQCDSGSGDCNFIGEVLAGISLCQPDQNWHLCTGSRAGEISLDGLYTCTDGAWRLVCSPANKYKTEYEGVNKKICDGRQWRDCDSVTAGAIQDLNVEVSCTRAGTTVNYPIKEIICNNGLDDDNDGDIDRQDDPDCTADNLGYRIGRTNWNDRYEVIIKSTDEYTVSIN